MRAVVDGVAPGLGFRVEPHDVGERAEWQAYRFEIPVLLADGQEIARHRIDAAELERRLRALGDQRLGASGVSKL
jgi:hypothetical protein